jgi:PRTRC genetic system protein E
MFTALAAIIGENEEITVKITGAGKDGRMKVVVMPKAEKGSNLALAQPLALAASPQELDEGFVGTLMEFGASRTGLKEQVAVTATILSAAAQSEAGKATKALQSKGPKSEPKPEAGGNGDDDDDLGGDAGEGTGNDILDEGSTASTPAPVTPPAQPTPPAKAKANENDDLLSML